MYPKFIEVVDISWGIDYYNAPNITAKQKSLM